MITRKGILSHRYVGLLLALVGLSQLLLQLFLLGRGQEYVVTKLSIDDTYYYLQTAWNAQQLGFVTFDGIHRTNGVQFLWFGLIYLLTFLTTDKMMLLYTTLALSFTLNVLCYLVIWKIGQEVERPLLALLLAAIWSIESFALEFYSVGMENSLHAFVFWCVIWQVVIFVTRVQEGKQPNFMGLTVALVLNGWSRIDSGLLSAIFFLFCLATLYHHSGGLRKFIRRYGRSVVRSMAGAVLGALIMFVSFYLMAGTYLPVSGLVKSAVAGPEASEVVVLWLHALRLSAGGILSQPFPLLVVVTASIVIHLEKDSRGLTALRHTWYILLVSWGLYHLLLVSSGTLGDLQGNFWFFWYVTPWYIFWAISFGLLIDRLVALIGGEGFRVFDIGVPSRGDRLAHAAWLFGATFAIVIILFAYGHFFARVDEELTADVYTVRYHAAFWLDEHLPEDAVIASWNAGQLGYFSNRTVINLDGLVNNVEYYETVLLDEKPLAVYFEENNVDYVVDYVQGNRVYRRLRSPETDGNIWLETVRTFSVSGDERTLHVWRLGNHGRAIIDS